MSSEDLDDEMTGCGYSYDHDLTSDTEDGVTVARCRTCGAELIWDAETGEPL